MIENMNNSKIKSKVNTLKERERDFRVYVHRSIISTLEMHVQNNMHHNWEQNRESTHLSL